MVPKANYDDIKAEIFRLHKAGMKNTGIAKETKVERRKVAKIIKDMKEEDRLREVSGARRDVAGEYLKEHFRELEAASYFLIGITMPDYWISKLKSIPTDIKAELLDYLINLSFGPGRAQVYGMPRLATPPYSDEGQKPTETPTDEYYSMMQMVNSLVVVKKAEEIIIGLQKHVPKLWPLIQKWEDKSRDYNHALEQVLPRLRNIADELKIKPNQKDRAIKAAISIFWAEEPDEELSSRKIESQDKTANILLGYNRAIQQLNMLGYSLRELGDISGEILDMVNPSNLQKMLIVTCCAYCPVSWGIQEDAKSAKIGQISEMAGNT